MPQRDTARPAGLMDSSDASQLAGVLDRRVALEGSLRTSCGARVMSSAVPGTGAATQRLAGSASAGSADATGNGHQLPTGSAERWLGQISTRDAPQLPAGPADGPPAAARLQLGDVIAIQNAEATEFSPPRSLHNLARDALNRLSARPTREPVALDDFFPWMAYVAAHRQSAQIIGPGITRAIAMWRLGTQDCNRGGAPRLDFYFYRTDGTVCRLHPGNRPKHDAKLVFERSRRRHLHLLRRPERWCCSACRMLLKVPGASHLDAAAKQRSFSGCCCLGILAAFDLRRRWFSPCCSFACEPK